MESTLSIVWSELEARVGTFLGWGRGAKYGSQAWTDEQQFELDGIVGSALRRFYHQPVDQNGSAYNWSFLKPTASLTFLSGASTIDLPDDFGAFEDRITVTASGNSTQPWRVEWTNEAIIRQRYAVTPSLTGPPLLAAQRPLKGTSQTHGQKFQLLLYPLADQDYTLGVQYYINPDFLSSPFPYAYGGSQHSETILEGCLAIAEKRLDDEATVHAAEYERCLMASIGIDRRNKPQKLGYNRDRSDDWSAYPRPLHYAIPAVTYNGTDFND